MPVEIWISIFGAISAIIVAAIGAFLANKNSIILQIRKLKEEHYASYIESLHNHAAENSKDSLTELVLSRDKMFLIASEQVIKQMLEYEKNGIGNSSENHDKYLTELIKAIRKDLKLKDKDFPRVSFKKPTPE
ncbi:hypothetical protein J8281_05150 [Aquimarina sp. U1-2]|uniref:hypothetical protein n=1 Tax=Aquimarina sp. U1-2 TaxID=2823141 RepID=UPI001AED0571|nr:hypothetical protein [Aquimarina sp. U1-2]MBP2831569.1 hypothetical protein [Aquimarina sp. U1-2]